MGAEQGDSRKVKLYLVWISLSVILNAAYLGTGLYFVDQFCRDHNCDKASEGYCTHTVCAVIEDKNATDVYYKPPCLIEDGQPSHGLCVTTMQQDLVLEMLIVLPLSLYYVMVVWSLTLKIKRGDLAGWRADPHVHVAEAADEEQSGLLAGEQGSEDQQEHE
eukprot:TRINITY_DN49749_c0_g2_i1.p1 TRINITY_DN49749_c0_g2~~TRINITY_DN49749_c0_g2_i1.p1  ORF type:complete len:162 (-),score=37.81 TRINITY_DN49749_c0_g2_i1:237-722(-)